MTDFDRTGSACEELYRYLRLIAGGQAVGRFIEIRQATKPGGMAQHFIPVRQIGRAHQLIRTLAPTTDVYTGVLLRDRRAGGRDAVSTAHLVFVEIDAPDAERKLAAFHRPTVVIGSGTPGHVHAYWHLRQPVAVVELERANRRLAHRLGGDSASVDAARILRPPATLNHKHRPPVAVRVLETHAAYRYELGELIDDLPDPEGSPVRGLASHTRRRHHPIDQRLLGIAAAEYVGALTGQQPTRGGKVCCPFHDLSVGQAGSDDVSPGRSLQDASLNDRGARQEPSGSAASGRAGACSDRLRLVPPPVYFERLTGLRVGRSGKLRCLFHDDHVPSLHVYREPERGWYCFGCGRGGSIYDLAALLSGRSTRGSDFRELRRELESLFL